MKTRTKKPVLPKRRRRVVKSLSGTNPVRTDPTRTAGLRRRISAELKRRFARFKLRIVDLILGEDVLGLIGGGEVADGLATVMAANAGGPTDNKRWQFRTDPEKVKAFQDWLRSQLDDDEVGLSDEELWQRYVEEGFAKGAGRAFDDTNAARRVKAETVSAVPGYLGERDEFLRSAFANTVAVDKVKLLAGRAFDDMEGVTDDMALKMSRALTDGLVRGQSPRQIARDLSDQADLSRDRALTVARTEIVRAHAEGQLEALDRLGVEEVGVMVEWLTAGDEKVCPLCSPLEGVVLTIDEARGILPRHSNCRCAWLPANVGEDTTDQTRTKGEIDEALDEAEIDDLDVSVDRPVPVVSTSYDRRDALYQFSRLLANSFNPDQPRDESGRWAAVGGALVKAHPFPGKPPPSPPGSGRPDLVAKDPKLAAAVEAERAHTAAYHRAFIASVVDRTLNDPPPEVPSVPDSSATPGKRAGAFRKVVGQLEDVQADLSALDKEFSSHAAEVAGSHPEGREAVAAARRVLEGRERTIRGLLTAHIDSMPPDQQVKARRYLNSSLATNIGWVPVLNAGENCGTGAGGFQPGNTCGRSEGGTSARGTGRQSFSQGPTGKEVEAAIKAGNVRRGPKGFRIVKVGGKEYMLKPSADKKGEEAERLAAENAATAGVDVAGVHTVTVNGYDVNAVEWRPRGKSIADLGRDADAKAELATVSHKDVERHVLYDYVIGSADVHDGNYLIERGKLVGIDKELSFPDRPTTEMRPASFLRHMGGEKFHFSQDEVSRMTDKAKEIADHLEKQGRGAAAMGVRQRAERLTKLLELHQGAPTVEQLKTLGAVPPHLYNKLTGAT